MSGLRPLTSNMIGKRTISSMSFFKVYFPSGTWLKISLRTWRRPYTINMRVYPSATDQYNTDGLCSDLDGDGINDFKQRYAASYIEIPPSNQYPDIFSETWRYVIFITLILWVGIPQLTKQKKKTNNPKSNNSHPSVTANFKKFEC